MKVALIASGVGFRRSSGVVSEKIVPYDAGVPIGNMTGGGGLAVAFDGNLTHPSTACARRFAATGSIVGKDWGAGNSKKIVRIEFALPSDTKIDGGAGATSITVINLYGSPDGTIGSDTLIETFGPLTNDANGQVFTIDVTPPFAGFRMHYLEFAHNGGAETDVAELTFTELA